MLKYMTKQGKGTLIQRALSYTLIRQLCIIGLVATVLLVVAWWRYSSELSQAASIPAPTIHASVLSPVPSPVEPITQLQVTGQQTPAPVVKTQLEVNGQTIPVPTNGTVEETVQSPDGNSSVHLSVDATSTGSKSTSSSTRIQMNSTSHSQVVTNETH